MIGFKKRDTKDLLKTIARTHGISVAEVRVTMQATIDEARNNPDPEKQAEFKKIFWEQHSYPRRIYLYNDKKAESQTVI